MKNNSPRVGRLVAALATCLLSLTSAQASNDKIPTGTLTVDRSLVRVGSHTNLDWEIQYPSTDEDPNPLVDTDLTPTVDVTMRVRVLGVAFQSGSTLLPFQGNISVNNSSWTTFFQGNEKAVNPNKVLFEQKVEAGENIKFIARGGANAAGSSWLTPHQTNNNDQYAIVLKDGDTPPAYAPAYNQGTVKSFMSKYLDSAGKISIGENDLIVLWEGSSARPGTTYFDMQDLVVLVSFEEVVTKK